MTITSIISAIGNTNKQAPLAARERFLDEYAVSAVWLGCIPLVDKISNFVIRKKGFNPNINLKLFKESDCQGINLNIKNFEGKVSDSIIKELKKVKDNKAIYEKLLASKFVLSTTIPMALMGFVLPKLIFASSSKKIEKLRKQKEQKNLQQFQFKNPMEYIKNGQISFKGNLISQIANFSTVEKMAVTDGGYGVGRVATARNKNEALDVGFKMTGMMILNFLFPPYLAKFLDKLTYKVAGLNVALDPLILDDKRLLEAIKKQNLKLPATSTEKDIIEFLDKNPKSLFSQYATKFYDVKYLENGIRDPRAEHL